MLSKKLIAFLNVLSQKELDKLDSFIRSPYHNEQPELIRLYALIRPSFENKKPTPSKLEVWNDLFPKKAYNDVKIRKLASLLLALAIEFKALEILKEQPEQKLLLELKAVSKPELTTHIAGINRKLQQLHQKKGHNTIESHFFNYEFSIQNHKIIELTKNRKELLRLKDLHNANKHLDIFVLAKKLEIAADIIGYQGFMQTNDAIRPQEILEITKHSPFFDAPIIRTYYLIVLMLSFPEDESNFFELKNWLQNTPASFNKDQEKTFYAHLINYCITHKINKGNERFLAEAFEIFTIMLDKKLIIDPFIDPDYYRNIISIGLQLKKYNYIQDFIQQYSELLPPDQKENAKTYNLARLYYTQKKYDRVLELLQNVELTNVAYALGAKSILVATYYALDEYRALDSLLVSFRVYVLRNRFLSKTAKQGYLNFLKFTKRLLHLAPYDHTRREKLKKKIETADSLMGRDWLLAQINGG